MVLKLDDVERIRPIKQLEESESESDEEEEGGEEEEGSSEEQDGEMYWPAASGTRESGAIT